MTHFRTLIEVLIFLHLLLVNIHLSTSLFVSFKLARKAVIPVCKYVNREKSVKLRSLKATEYESYQDYEGLERASDNEGFDDNSGTRGTTSTQTETSYRLRRPVKTSPASIEKSNIKKNAREKSEKKKKAVKKKPVLEPYTKYEPHSQLSHFEQVMSPSKTFSELGIDNDIVLSNLDDILNVYEPTKIQEMSLSHLSSQTERKDNNSSFIRGSHVEMILHAQTGSGKTLAFLLPLVNIIDPKISRVRYL